jgi:hypothetical protein
MGLYAEMNEKWDLRMVFTLCHWSGLTWLDIFKTSEHSRGPVTWCCTWLTGHHRGNLSCHFCKLKKCLKQNWKEDHFVNQNWKAGNWLWFTLKTVKRGKGWGGGGRRRSLRGNHGEDHFLDFISRVTKNKISLFSRYRYLETQKRNNVWNHLTIF